MQEKEGVLKYTYLDCPVSNVEPVYSELVVIACFYHRHMGRLLKVIGKKWCTALKQVIKKSGGMQYWVASPEPINLMFGIPNLR